MKLCTQCKSLNADTAKFCNDCGGPLCDSTAVSNLASAAQADELPPVNQAGVKLLGGFFLGVVGLFCAGMVYYTPTPRDPANAVLRLQVTAEHYQGLQKGMTLAQCNQLIGQPGQEQSRAGDGQYEVVTVSWVNWTGSNITAMFQGGKLISKAQLGLY